MNEPTNEWLTVIETGMAHVWVAHEYTLCDEDDDYPEGKGGGYCQGDLVRAVQPADTYCRLCLAELKRGFDGLNVTGPFVQLTAQMRRSAPLTPLILVVSSIQR